MESDLGRSPSGGLRYEVGASRWGGCRLGVVGSTHAVEHNLTLPVDQTCEQLLRVSEDEGPGKDLRRRVQRGEARNELPTHEEQSEEGGDRAEGQLEDRQRNRDAVPFRRALDTADGCGCRYRGGRQPHQLDNDEI